MFCCGCKMLSFLLFQMLSCLLKMLKLSKLSVWLLQLEEIEFFLIFHLKLSMGFSVRLFRWVFLLISFIRKKIIFFHLFHRHANVQV